MSTTYQNIGPIYITTEKYNALVTAGTVEVGREYVIVDANAPITKIKVNGTEQTITDQTVDITVPQGTITGITMNGSSKGTSGVVDLGTVLTSHQDISGKADKASLTAGTAGTSSATSGATLAVPYVTMNAQGIVTGYGTHTHTINSLGVSAGGTGASTLASGAVLIGNGTGAVQTRTITNNTSSASVSGTNIPTCNTVANAITNRLNRSTAVNAEDGSDYNNGIVQCYMVRGEAFAESDTEPSLNGEICWTVS